MSKIEWTNKTWNPVVGCSKVSPGCKNCYAIHMAWRLQHIGHSAQKYSGTVEKSPAGKLNWTGKVNIIEKEFVKPFTWKKPTMIFVNSESDLFHESVPFQVVRALFGVMSVCKQHTFQILTKRPQRMFDFFEWLKLMDPDWQDDPANYAYDICVEHGIETGCGSAFETEAWPLKNVWLGVSVENQQAADERISLLLQVPAAVRFLSCEPLLGPVTLPRHAGAISTVCITCSGTGKVNGIRCPRRCIEGKNPFAIDWIIAGGESGKDARPMNPYWVRSLRDQSVTAGIPFFFKQWGEWRIYDHWDGDNARVIGQFYFDEFHQGNYIIDHKKRSVCMAKVGKKTAGRLLDGREWNELPGQQTSTTADDPDLFFTGTDY
jgi:protein gp37